MLSGRAEGSRSRRRVLRGAGALEALRATKGAAVNGSTTARSTTAEGET
jgi:hypothetical protein